MSWDYHLILKSEIRISKFETNSNDQNCFEHLRIRICFVLRLPCCRQGFRVSNLCFELASVITPLTNRTSQAEGFFGGAGFPAVPDKKI
jgi:hypothetical protein